MYHVYTLGATLIGQGRGSATQSSLKRGSATVGSSAPQSSASSQAAREIRHHHMIKELL